MKNKGEARLRVIPMPSDANPHGKVFGGWITAQIDLAGSVAARELCPARVVTAGMDKVSFKAPALIGDLVSCYAEVVRVGTSSITIEVELVAERVDTQGWHCCELASALITYVSVDEEGRKVPLSEEIKRLRGF